jgi:hypothetical protein
MPKPATLSRPLATRPTGPNVVGPQPGPQEQFLATPADIAIYGGAAGGGKSWALLLEPLRHKHNPNFGAVIFRRTSVQIRNEGALWDESRKLYPNAGGVPHAGDLWWGFPSGASVAFAHLQHEDTVLDWQGSQIPLICFDELTHFEQSQFWYLVSRNRTTCGVRPYIRATCNPDVDSWVAELIAWWIDQDTGYPIPERAGVLRWFVRVGDDIKWGDAPADLAGWLDPTGKPIPPKSLTFVPSKLTDNRILMDADPGYVASLMALPLVERERLLGGNWKIRWQGNALYTMDCFLVGGRPVAWPAGCDAVYGVMDTATKTGKKNDSTGVSYYARSRHYGIPLTLLDWDAAKIEGSLLINYLPAVFDRGEELARICRARNGFVGVYIEDKDSGQILLQQAARHKDAVGRPTPLRAIPIPAILTAMGKEERALSVSGHIYNGKCKWSQHAYDKVVVLDKVSKNHMKAQVENFFIGDPAAGKRADDLFDTLTYGVALGLGDGTGL